MKITDLKLDQETLNVAEQIIKNGTCGNIVCACCPFTDLCICNIDSTIHAQEYLDYYNIQKK